ncbi:MAG: glycogen debranching protein GlgX [Acidobacteriota bacterium]
MNELSKSPEFSWMIFYGAGIYNDGVQFSVFSRHAESMRILLYESIEDVDPVRTLELDKNRNRRGDVWSIWTTEAGVGQLYHIQTDGPFAPESGHRFNAASRLVDPYAKALAGDFFISGNGLLCPPKCVVVDDGFDWRGDRPLGRPLHESIVYEMHVRGFTRSQTSGIRRSGGYLGIVDKIPYLQSLGITAVELMPIFEFSTREPEGSKSAFPNYWGYDPIAPFAPHRGYALSGKPGAQVAEFKQMVRELHASGIEVFLDVVFNHTAERDAHGPTFHFKGLENGVYYMLEPNGSGYRNFSGCGNTVNCNHPIVRDLILNCLRYWVHHYHIDGFRFDLASILSRGRDGEMLANPPVLEAISEDPLLAGTKIIAEPWDAAGAYQVGSFGCTKSGKTTGLPWAEWNGRYRDDVRRFWLGDPSVKGSFATRLSGSSDLYQAGGRRPYHSINFITSHDGFTLNDLVSYSRKHNEANGEDNRDGENANHSHNYGVEGPTDRIDVESVRRRQIKNMLATLLLSQGVPMLVMGDECRRTQQGNNNAYCQDNELSWFDWTLIQKHHEIWRFCRELIRFRREEPVIRQENFLEGVTKSRHGLPDVAWYGNTGDPIDWHNGGEGFICVLSMAEPMDAVEFSVRHIMMLFHNGDEPEIFSIPEDVRLLPWRVLLDTAAESPRDIYSPDERPRLEIPADNALKLRERSMMVFTAGV